VKVRRLSEKEFKYIYSKVPRLCVEVVIKTDEGILLTKRDIPPAKGKWHIPGGTVLFRETLKQAVKRIAKREVGLNVVPEKILDVLEYTQSQKVGDVTGHAVGVLFLCKVASGKLRGSKEGRNVGWFKSLPEPIIFEHKEFLSREFGLL